MGVSNPSTVDFTWEPDPQCNGYPVQFHGITTRPVNSWSWDFGDNTSLLPSISSWSFQYFQGVGGGNIPQSVDPVTGDPIYILENASSGGISGLEPIPTGSIILINARHPSYTGSEFYFGYHNQAGNSGWNTHFRIDNGESAYKDYMITLQCDVSAFSIFVRSDAFYIRSITLVGGNLGNISSEQNPTHTYKSPGVYTVKLLTTDATTNESVSKQVTISDCKPLATFEWEPTTPRVNHTVTFINNSIPITGTPITSVTWDYGDGTSHTLSGNQEIDTHIYTSPGTYTVKLTITDGVKTSDTTRSITIVPEVIIAEFTCPETFKKGTPFTLVNKSVNATSYSWTFGDGTTSTDINPTHTYNTSANYPIRLTASNAFESVSITHNISISGGKYVPPIVFNWSGYLPKTHSLIICEALGGISGGIGWPVENFGPLTFNWDGMGTILLCGSADGTGLIMADDWYELTTQVGVKSEEMARPYNGVWQPGRDVTSLFTKGNNTVTFKIWSSICCYYGHSPFWLVQVYA